MNTLTSVHVTTGGSKMEGIPSVNVSSLENDFCKKASKVKGSVCGKCYSNRLTKMRKNLEIRLLQNSDLLSDRLLTESELPVFNNRFVRFNSFGELINETHMANLIAIAKRNPYTTFGLWTKQSDIVMNFDKVPNIKYIFSVSKVDGRCSSKPILKYFDKIFVAVTNKEETNCNKDCLNCLICYTDNSIKIIKEKLK